MLRQKQELIEMPVSEQGGEGGNPGRSARSRYAAQCAMTRVELI